MSNNSVLSLQRVALLIRNDIVANWVMIRVAVAAIVAILILYNLVFTQDYYHAHPQGYFLILFLGGLWITSLAFTEIHNEQKSGTYLTLPCSQLEKVLSRLLLTSILYIIVTLALYTLFYWIVDSIVRIRTGLDLPLFNPFQPIIFHWIADYLILQSVLFLGAIYFKSHVIVKTIATVGIFGLVLMFYILLLGFIYPSGLYAMYVQIPGIQQVLQIVMWPILPIYCWVLSYIRFTDTESV